jgi:hypothetical protein
VAAPGLIQVGIPPDIESTSPLAPAMRLILFPTLESPFEKVRLVEKEVIYPQIEARLALVVARAPERLVRLEFVVLREPDKATTFMLVTTRPEFVLTRLLLSLLRLFERVVILASSIERRSNIVEKILENAPCRLARSGAESNSIVPWFPLIILIDFFQSFIHAVLFCIELAELSSMIPVFTGVVTGSFLVNETRVPIHESSMTGFVRIYTYVFGGVVYEASV